MAVAIAPDSIAFGWGYTQYKLGLEGSTLFSTSTKHNGIRGLLPGRLGQKTYEMTTPNGTLGQCIGGARDLVVQVARMVFPFQLIDGSRDDCSSWSNAGYFAISALYTTSMVVLATVIGIVPVITELAVVALFSCVARHVGDRFKEYFPLKAAIPLVLVGVAVCFPAAFVTNSIATGVMILLNRMGFSTEGRAQDVELLLHNPQLKWLVATYAVVGAPILEELAFRGGLQDYLAEYETKPNNGDGLSWERFCTIAKVSFIFGLCHTSSAQGWLNIPIVVSIGLLGLVMGLTKELTGSLWAPWALHATNNAIAVADQLF